MVSFFKLYIATNNFGGNSLEIIMLILYANIIIYIMDFHNLVKRKSMVETMAIMIIPTTLSAVGAMLTTIYIHIPEPYALAEFYIALNSRSLSTSLLLVPVAYAFFWSVTFFSMETRSKKEMMRWVLLSLPDYCFMAVVSFCLAWHLAVGENIFSDKPARLLWFFLYGLYFLCCKVILLMTAFLIRLYSSRLSVFKWHERKDPAAFLVRYFFFYQNAVLRNFLLFEFGCLFLITYGLYREGFTYQSAAITGFLYLCAAFTILFCLAPMIRLMNKFSLWSISCDIRELFCREYFTAEPLYKDQNYTVTRHFLVDEQRPAVVYYWPTLKSIGRWSVNKDGKSRILYFSDGESCKFTGEESGAIKPVFWYAQKIMDAQEISV